MTTYTQNDLEGWEFKIVRSNGKIIGDKFQELIAEEAKNGWELVEKFDDYRIRFKRRIEKRQQDSCAEIDPYRTQVGISDARLVFMILGGVFAFVAILVGIIILTTTG